MFTDQEIRTAMGGLVKEKGEDHTGVSRYAHPVTGKGECFLGALCEYMNWAIPSEGTRAGNVLGQVSKPMQDAFALAQYLNDQHFEWKYVLMGVDEVLAGNFDKQALGCPCGCAINAGYNGIVEKIKARRALDRAHLPKTPEKYFASGGIVTSGGMKVTGFTASMGSLTFSIDMAASNLSAFSAAFFNEGMLVQKDHALVA